MSDAAIIGAGTILRASTSAWPLSEDDAIGEIRKIMGPNRKREVHDTTSFNAPGGYKEYKVGYGDSAIMSLRMSFTQDTYMFFNSNYESEDVLYFEIYLPDAAGTVFRLKGWVKTLNNVVRMSEAINADVEIKVTGGFDVVQPTVWQDRDDAIWQDRDDAIWEDRL